MESVPEDDLRLAPPQGESPEAIRSRLAEENPQPPSPSRPPEADVERSFSLAHLLSVLALASLGLALIQWLPPTMAAGILGLVVLAGVFVLSLHDNYPATAWLAWWTLLLVYLVACVAAGFR